MKIALIGFGVVGQGLVEILRDKAQSLQGTTGLNAQLVAVATRNRGSLYHPEGLDPAALLAAITQGHLDHYPHTPDLRRNWDTLRIIRESNADVVAEASVTNLDTGQPALDYCHAAFDSGKHVILANKGPIAVAYDELIAHARRTGKLLRFEATVMAGTPSLQLALRALAGCQILAARGIVNGTTNYILTEMEKGIPYAEALAQAQRLGYAEADPSADVDGWDAAAKVIILAAGLFEKRLRLADMEVKGIAGITPANVEAAQANGERYKLIAHVTPTGGSVQPICLPISDPLASITGVTNAITYTTDLLGDVTLIGPGAGRLQTGFALLADLLEIHRTV